MAEHKDAQPLEQIIDNQVADDDGVLHDIPDVKVKPNRYLQYWKNTYNSIKDDVIRSADTNIMVATLSLKKYHTDKAWNKCRQLNVGIKVIEKGAALATGIHFGSSILSIGALTLCSYVVYDIAMDIPRDKAYRHILKVKPIKQQS